MTYEALRVLRHALLASDPVCGSEIAKALKLSSGTVYPALARLKRAGLLEHVATLRPPDEPASHFYAITTAGHEAFLRALLDLMIPTDLWGVKPPG